MLRWTTTCLLLVSAAALGAAAAAYGRYLSEEEHEHVGRIRTDEAIAQLAQSPEFSAWIAKNAHRVRIVR